jgi:Lrp/AsnC family leucine-responsive transcriptional regulator
MAAPLNLDRIDLRILKKLQENGKITNLQLSSDVGLSTAPTLERVRKLESHGYIKGYHAVLNEGMLGISIQAFVMVTLRRHAENSFDEFSRAVNGIREVMEVYLLTGDSDYLLKVVAKDIQSFQFLLTDKLGKIESITQMKTMVILNNIKKSSVLPLDY